MALDGRQAAPATSSATAAAVPTLTALTFAAAAAEIERQQMQEETLRAAQSMVSLVSTPTAPPGAILGGPIVGALIILRGSTDVHQVISVDSSVGTPFYILSGMSTPTTLSPPTTPGGSRWAPVDAATAATPVTLLDRFKVVAWVINLHRSEQRMANMTTLLPSDLVWHRCDAVDGQTLNWPALVRGGYVTEAAARLGEENHPTICHSSHSFSPHLSLGAVGCARSHYERWRALVDSAHRFALILEDDIDVISPDLCHALTEIFQRKREIEFCYLGSHECMRTVKAAGARVQLREVHRNETVSGLFGYVISRAAATRLIDSVFPLSEQIDVALNRLPWGLGKRWAVAFEAPLVMAPPSQYGSEVQIIGENAFAALPPSAARHVVAGDVDRTEPRQSAVVRVDISLKEHPEVLACWSLFRRQAGSLGVELATVAEIRPNEILSICSGHPMVRPTPPNLPSFNSPPLCLFTPLPRLTAEIVCIHGLRAPDPVGTSVFCPSRCKHCPVRGSQGLPLGLRQRGDQRERTT